LKILGREPTLWIAVINSVIVVLGTFSFHWLTGQQAGLIVAAINAVSLAVNAYLVRPIQPAAFTYAIAALVAVVASYGINVSAETLAAINLAVVPILALLTRSQVSPQDSRISSS
jgi:hypothetical protein